jgi:hypothetical protein
MLLFGICCKGGGMFTVTRHKFFRLKAVQSALLKSLTNFISITLNVIVLGIGTDYLIDRGFSPLTVMVIGLGVYLSFAIFWFIYSLTNVNCMARHTLYGRSNWLHRYESIDQTAKTYATQAILGFNKLEEKILTRTTEPYQSTLRDSVTELDESLLQAIELTLEHPGDGTQALINLVNSLPEILDDIDVTTRSMRERRAKEAVERIRTATSDVRSKISHIADEALLSLKSRR